MTGAAAALKPTTGEMGRVRHVHMVGIGGIGMSSIAEVLLRRGYLHFGGLGGPSRVLGNLGRTSAWWSVLATLSPNAVRGEWQAAA